MKSILTHFASILFIIFSLNTYSQDQNESSTPGENPYLQQNGVSSSQSLEESYLALKADILEKNDRIQSLYFIQQDVLDSYGGGTQTITKSLKRNIYKAGQTLMDVQTAQIQSLDDDDYLNKVEVMREIEKIQDRLIYFSGKSETRQIEKKLKKLKTADLIKPIFFQEL